MAKMVSIDRTGGPEVIGFTDAVLAPPGRGEVRMRNTAIGVNFIDTYHRGGVYPIDLPSGLGLEAVGIVEQLGEGVTGLRPGDRVGTFGPARGAYATERNLPASALLPIPDDIDDETAAAALLKGCTVECLVERCANVEAGWPVLVHAAAGGVGLILVRWLKAIGATVIGTVSTEAKAKLARGAGADHIILYSHEDTVARVREITGGTGVRVTFDGVGASTWESSLASTARRGLIVSYGNAGGPVTGVALGTLATHGSLFVTRPMLFDYFAEAGDRSAGDARLWEMIRTGQVSITIGRRYPLDQAAQAHRDLEGRATTGSSLLLP